MAKNKLQIQNNNQSENFTKLYENLDRIQTDSCNWFLQWSSLYPLLRQGVKSGQIKLDTSKVSYKFSLANQNQELLRELNLTIRINS